MRISFYVCMIFVVFLVFTAHCNAGRLRRVRRGWLSNSKPSGVKCAFDPCTVPGFCGTGRTCEMDDTCRHNCECEAGSTHEDCKETALELTATPAPMQCTFNPCHSPAFACDGGRKCVLDEHCLPSCECLKTSTHPSCHEGTDKTTEPSIEITTVIDRCETGEITCIHGECTRDKNRYTCVCEKGWGGDTCNESKCTMECSEGFYCHFVTANVQICVENVSKPRATSASPITSPTVMTRVSNVCDAEYETRDKDDRTCPSGITCEYGVCTIDDGEDRCKCDPLASGSLCEHKCCRECGEFGTCTFDEQLVEVCMCQTNYTGINCTSLKSELNETYTPPKEVTWHYWVVGACVLVLLILLILMVAVPYIMWKNRVILVMKVVHYFQGYEDDDERQWDAFISYKSTTADETYVVKTLFPKLEKELGFKVNVHFRDFSPGETIANNIIKAVQCSRRTIMIITPSYVTSEFTKFEYEVAQQEMLKRKHRIIPILLEDITECKDTMDPNLKLILNSVTYIEWPQESDQKKLDKFWNRIELSMPKIKNRSNDDSIKTSSNGQVTMSKPEDISISFTNKDKAISNSNIPNGNTNIYSIIDEMKLDPEEVYNELNESEMQSKVFKKEETRNGNPTQTNGLNGLKIDI